MGSYQTLPLLLLFVMYHSSFLSSSAAPKTTSTQPSLTVISAISSIIAFLLMIMIAVVSLYIWYRKRRDAKVKLVRRLLSEGRIRWEIIEHDQELSNERYSPILNFGDSTGQNISEDNPMSEIRPQVGREAEGHADLSHDSSIATHRGSHVNCTTTLRGTHS